MVFKIIQRIIHYEKIYKYLITTICLAISSFMLFINEYYWKSDPFLYNLMLSLAISLLTTSFVSMLSNFFQNNSVDEAAQKNFLVLNHCQKNGLIGIYDEFPLNDDKIRYDFLNSKNVYIIMNDAKAFISSHTILLENRIQQSKCTTTFILQDYDTEDIMNVLSRKNGHEKKYYRNKIIDVINYHLNHLIKNSHSSHRLSVYLNNNYNTLAIILTDHYAMYSIYRVSSGKTSVPHFVFSSNGEEYQKIHDDINKVIKSSKKYTYTK